ncbi:MAG: hypothetical protein ABJ327_15720 [Litoreibacter sp.]
MARVYDTLRREKVSLDPHIALTYFHLTDIPRDEAVYEHLTLIQGRGPGPELYVDVDYHPMKLLDLPYDAEAVGELAISFITQGLQKLETYEGFPHALIHEAISDFRKARYRDEWKVTDKTIQGTKMKGRVDAIVSASQTVCTLTVSYRGKRLFEREIMKEKGARFRSAGGLNNFLFQDDKLLIFNGQHMFVPSITMELSELPDVFRDYIRK